MPKFCENCGTKLEEEQDVCLGCGKVVSKSNTKSAKKYHNGYFTSTSIIMIIIAVCLFVADADSDFENVLMYTIPGLFALGAAITALCGKKNKAALIVSGALYIAGAICNIVAIANISIFTILACVFGGLNIYYGIKLQ